MNQLSEYELEVYRTALQEKLARLRVTMLKTAGRNFTSDSRKQIETDMDLTQRELAQTNRQLAALKEA